MVKVLLFASALLLLAHSFAGQSSPCPDVFRYAFNASSLYFGIVTVPSPQFGTVNILEITLSLPIGLTSRCYGSIDVMTDQRHVLQKIFRAKTMKYRIELPVQQPLPIVTSILLNGQSICEGPNDPNELIRIQLNHTLTSRWKICKQFEVAPFTNLSTDAERSAIDQ